MIRINIITCILLLLFVAKSHSQHAYISIPTDSAIWVMAKEDWHEGQPPQPHTYTYDAGRMEGVDTMLNGKTYHCYFGDRQYFDMPFPVPKSYPAKSSLFIRQDSATKKVYYFPKQGFNFDEYVLYDFSLQKGDTIIDSNYYFFSPKRLFPYKAWVDNVDSINWLDGTWRYRWWIKSKYGPSSNPAKAIIIEGMGYTTHLYNDPLLEFHPIVSITNSVVCFKSKTEWLYKQPNPWNADCDSLIDHNIIPISIETLYVNDLSKPLLYPNPVKSEEHLTLNIYAGKTNEQCIIEAYSFSGQKILHEQITPGSKLKISKYDIKPGLYLFVVSNKQNILFREKLLIQ